MSVGPLVFLAGRYLKSRRRHRGVGAPLLSLGGLAAGVMALNVVLGAMNGFQLTFIESLLELSSSHVRWTPPEGPVAGAEALIAANGGVRAVVPTTESQVLIASSWGGRRGAVLRGFPPEAARDAKLIARLGLTTQLPSRGEVLLGSELARALGVIPGDQIDLTSLTGTSFSLLKPRSVSMTVKGTFTTRYVEIDSTWVLASLDDTREEFAGPRDFFYAIKLDDGNADQVQARRLAALLNRPASEWTTWRDYNAAFFGALRTEKSVMMVLVGLIFFVVGVNIYFSQKRAVLEHREDLALWRAVGVRPGRLRAVFALEGLLVGLAAAAVGTALGLAGAGSLASLDLLSSDAFYLPAWSAQVVPLEVMLIALACTAASTAAAWFASASVAQLPVAEVLKSS